MTFRTTLIYRGRSKQTGTYTQLLFIIVESCRVWHLGRGSCLANRENCWSSVATGAVRQYWPPVRPSSLNWTKLLRSVVSRRQGLLKMVFVLEFITRIPCIYAVARLPWVCSLTRGGEAVELTRSEARERRTARAPKDSNWTKRLCPV